MMINIKLLEWGKSIREDSFEFDTKCSWFDKLGYLKECFKISQGDRYTLFIEFSDEDYKKFPEDYLLQLLKYTAYSIMMDFDNVKDVYYRRNERGWVDTLTNKSIMSKMMGVMKRMGYWYEKLGLDNNIGITNEDMMI